ncbi:MAG TPA: glycosyltransferase family 2 protein [Terriglobales bacterium]|nr:glycosyltransferase family 2 protein [Terriglobales bacterium]
MDSSLPTPLPKLLNPEVSIPQVSSPEVSIIVPARNEEASLGACLESLTAQTGVTFEIVVVDDASTDRTREIAQGFAGVRAISPRPLHEDGAGKKWTGKNNAMIAGAKAASAPWLLFTDADTVHLPGSLARALEEAKNERADLLSYSPEQVVVTFAERAVMPVIFGELAAHYPPRKVCDQNSGQGSRQGSRQTSRQGSRQGSGIAAANGQYILVRRATYDAVGGHAAVATEILEDVALARLFRNAGRRLYFRYGGDAVRTRMYRNWAQLREGWTKNLALLFPQSEFLAFQSLFLWFGAWSALGFAASGAVGHHLIRIACAALWLLMYRRIHAAHFTTVNNLLAIVAGLPMFAYLLLRSKKAHANNQVSWKGRTYKIRTPSGSAPREMQAPKPIPQIEKQGLRTES